MKKSIYYTILIICSLLIGFSSYLIDFISEIKLNIDCYKKSRFIADDNSVISAVKKWGVGCVAIECEKNYYPVSNTCYPCGTLMHGSKNGTDKTLANSHCD